MVLDRGCGEHLVEIGLDPMCVLARILPAASVFLTWRSLFRIRGTNHRQRDRPGTAAGDVVGIRSISERVTDKGLVHLKRFSNRLELAFGVPNVSDGVLGHHKEMVRPQRRSLFYIQNTDAGRGHLERIANE